MLIYSLRKILGSIPKMFVLAALTFFMLRLAPGGPFDTDRVFPAEIQAAINAQYELDKPLINQFASWMGSVLQGDLRESFQYTGRPVAEMITESLPPSLLLGGLALLLSIIVGIPLGCLAAARQNTWLDTSAMLTAVAGVSLPSYLTASVLVVVFSLQLGWFPPALWEGPASMVLPVITLASRPLAIIARLTRASMLEALSSDYVRTAYAKGQRKSVILFKHALKNSLIPVLSVMGPLGANLVTGSIAVEVIFQIPGMGKHFVSAVLNRDYPLVMGVTLAYGVILLLFNLISDLLCAWSDPRISI